MLLSKPLATTASRDSRNNFDLVVGAMLLDWPVAIRSVGLRVILLGSRIHVADGLDKNITRTQPTMVRKRLLQLAVLLLVRLAVCHCVRGSVMMKKQCKTIVGEICNGAESRPYQNSVDFIGVL